MRIGKVETLGKTCYLDLAKARSRSNRSSLGFNFPYPHHDPVKDSLFLVPETRKFHRKRGSYFFCLVPRVPSGTARGCLVQAVRHSLLFIYVSNYDVTTQSATIPATSEGSRDVKENIIAYFSLKCISQRGTRKIIKSQCWIQTDKSQSRVLRCHIPVSATASTGICDIVSPSTEICQSGSNTGTWFY